MTKLLRTADGTSQKQRKRINNLGYHYSRAEPIEATQGEIFQPNPKLLRFPNIHFKKKKKSKSINYYIGRSISITNRYEIPIKNSNFILDKITLSLLPTK